VANDGIFVISGELESPAAELFEMVEQPYDSEDVLQSLIERYPNLLAGGQIDPESPRRWLLIRREQPVPGMDEGAGRWSLDHLLIDQDGIPTLVEVKQAKDTRIRREVVGQMMDYAANGVAYWPIERIRASFEARVPDSVEAVHLALGAGVDPEALWQAVEGNLSAGKVRLIFLADIVPAELRRIVEFLNDQMRAEVLAVEVKQYRSSTNVALRTLVARVYGRTEKAEAAKSGGRLPSKQWDEQSFFDEIAQSSPDDAAVAHRLLAWARGRGLEVFWGRGARVGSFWAWAQLTDERAAVFAVQTDGKMSIDFQRLKRFPAFAEADDRRMFVDRLNAVPGLRIPERLAETWTYPPLSGLRDDNSFDAFVAALDWAVERCRPLPE
jgi:hypothetical protein